MRGDRIRGDRRRDRSVGASCRLDLEVSGHARGESNPRRRLFPSFPVLGTSWKPTRFCEVCLDVFGAQFCLGARSADAIFDETFVNGQPGAQSMKRFEKMEFQRCVEKGLILLEY